eukprot:CAMPEP_0177163330 /NCGR_PEP_ID=MMETSP0367-20130122/6358_1 /TAXON_ID=447022 ORGANISM="Scrippsiella hangoei-like, Strain SHHI-4" /NCGR_SAMPLE_ID=MMETSP0367 /ASSEMBLY_ACC=CAM_ASM_000362 /LENGTH=455 /DNA_ID=CAMNT_0018609155 /DNA_START=31 /DNA_END=1396 /DNA_ORIENTATION=-
MPAYRILALALALALSAPQVGHALVHGATESRPSTAASPSFLSLAEQRQRARSREQLRRRSEDALEQAQAPALGTPPPEFSILNVTTPTLVPPTARLDPWSDAQPVDTAIGTLIVSGFQERPTQTPPPSQNSLDVVMAGCPMTLTWPVEVSVTTFNPCDSSQIASWLDAATNEPILEYSQSCSPFRAGMAPILSYSLIEGGHLMVQSQTITTLTGSKIALMDCRGMTRYLLEEKVYHEKKGKDMTSCEKYGSCDGIVWIQYFMYKANGTLVAQTPYLHIFEPSIKVVDPKTGVTIATATRIGSWEPGYSDCQGERRWHLVYAPPEEQPAGPFASPTEQWPLAAMLSVISIRDASRNPNGLVSPTWCELWKGSTSLMVLGAVVVALGMAALVFLRDVVPPLTAGLYELEVRILRRRMFVPSKYVGDECAGGHFGRICAACAVALPRLAGAMDTSLG